MTPIERKQLRELPSEIICYRQAVMIAAGLVARELAGLASLGGKARAYEEAAHALVGQALLDYHASISIVVNHSVKIGDGVRGGICRWEPRSWFGRFRQWLASFIWPQPEPEHMSSDEELLNGYARLFCPYGGESEFLSGVREHARIVLVDRRDRLDALASATQEQGELTAAEVDRILSAPGTPASVGTSPIACEESRQIQ